MYVKYRQCGMRPALQPPPIVFIVGWAILYALVGVSLFTYWRHVERSWSFEMIFGTLSVAAMMSWWLVFSLVCRPRLAFAALCVILALIVATAGLFYKAGGRLSALFLLPLVAWLVFACYLSWASM